MQSPSVVAYINIESMLKNLSILRGMLSPTCTVISMVKANAYGHGLLGICKHIENHTDYLGVASIDEGIAVRSVGIKKKIIIFSGFFDVGQISLLVKYDLIPIIHSDYQLDILDDLFKREKKEIWIKVNTGMNRLGFPLNVFDDLYQRIKSSYVGNEIGVLTHLAESDATEDDFTKSQISLFREAMEGKNFSYVSVSNSASVLNGYCNSEGYNTVRPGVSLYGVSTLKNKSISHQLKAVMTLCSRIIAINSVKKGEYIGYNCSYIAPYDMRIAVVAIGYGDGYPYGAPSDTPVLIRDRRCSLVGRVSMDMITVDITHCDEVCQNDEVVLWGGGLPVEEVAKIVNTSPYVLISNVSDRVRRVYLS
jgi:alanine racemase